MKISEIMHLETKTEVTGTFIKMRATLQMLEEN